MEKIQFQYTPLADDYAKSIKIYSSNKQKRNSIGYGVIYVVMVFLLLNFVLNNDTQLIAYSLPLFFICVLILLSPSLSAWIMKTRTSKQPQLLQVITHEIDNERITLTNQVSENKLDWSIFNKAIETKEYYFLIYTINKNMFQFIPKRAFVSPEQETSFRNLVEQKLGKIQDIQKGLRGWKLTLLTFCFFMVFSGGCLLLAVLLES